MDVSELRKRIVRALDEARKDSEARRTLVDASTRDFAGLLENVAVPLLRQAAGVLKSEGQLFTVHTPAASARLASDRTPESYLELVLDTTTPRPQVLGRLSIARGRQGRIEERPIGPGKAIADITEEDIAQFIVRELPRLIVKS
jgi:hypothetical protein